MTGTSERVAKLALLVGAAALLTPAPALACPNCIAAQDETVQNAFLIASAFLTALPLGLIGSGVWWLRRRAARLEAEEAAGVIHLPLARRSRRA